MSARQRRRGGPAPVRLTPGEHLLWQGGPSWQAIAARVFHVRLIVAYFAVLILSDMVAARLHHMGRADTLRMAVPGLLTGAATMLILAVLAFAMGRTTRYTVTTRRVVMQFGVGLPATLVLPLHRIAAASVRVRADHAGDISLRLFPGDRIGFAKLWPHVRPWHLAAPEPMLRDVPQAAIVAAPLCRALAAAADARREARAAERLPLAS